MLAEIAAANAAIAVIKAALKNGKELSDLGSKVFDYFDNKAKIQEAVTKKGNRSDIEEFLGIRRPKGDVNRQCLNLHQCVVVDDKFMNKLEDRDEKSMKLWGEILKTRLETGEPYIMLETLFWLVLGAFIAWNFPQPQFAKNIQAKILTIFKKD